MLLCLALLGMACNKSETPGSGTSGAAQPPSEGTPAFTFTVERITPYTAAPGKLPKGVPPEVQKASDDISADMSAMFTSGFLDPENWQNGSYDSYFSHYDQKAGAQAKTEVDQLTAGTGAGEMYDDIQPGFAHLNTKVMVDEKGKPVLGVAIVEFNATATGTDGADTNLHAEGQFFMQPDGGGWKIFAYDADRQDGGDIPDATGSTDTKPEDKKKSDKDETS